MPGSRDIRQLGTQCENELIASPTCRWKKRGWVTRPAVAQLSNREPDRTVASSDASARGSLYYFEAFTSSLLCGRSGSFAAHTGGAFRHASRLGGSRRRWGDWERLHRTSEFTESCWQRRPMTIRRGMRLLEKDGRAPGRYPLGGMTDPTNETGLCIPCPKDRASSNGTGWRQAVVELPSPFARKSATADPPLRTCRHPARRRAH